MKYVIGAVIGIVVWKILAWVLNMILPGDD